MLQSNLVTEIAKMNELLRLKVINACYAMVSADFARYSTITYWTKHFDWNEFPEKCADRCKTELFVYVKYQKRHASEVESLAAATGAEIATYLVSQSDILKKVYQNG